MIATLLRNRVLVAEAIQAVIIAAALTGAFLLRFEFLLPAPYVPMLAQALPLALAVKLGIFRAFGLRHLAWRHVGFDDLVRLGTANLAAAAALAPLLRLLLGAAYPRSIYVLDPALCLLGEVAARSALRLALEGRRGGAGRKRALIYGAGEAGITVLNEIRANPELGYQVAGFLDDDPAKHRMRIRGRRVVGGREALAGLACRLGIEEVLVALPRATGGELTAILEACRLARVPAKRVPALAELISGRVLVDQIREVRLEDLLGRAPVRLDPARGAARLAGNVVLVTGAGGSIGGELCRQIARHGPRALIGFDQAETALYEIEQELAARAPEVVFHPEVGSIQDRRRLEEVFAAHRPDAVYHAAAYKHVPMMEAHLFEAIANNVFGTHNVVEASRDAGAADFVLISSDKAVRPTNVMGATKRVAELVCLAGAGGSWPARHGVAPLSSAVSSAVSPAPPAGAMKISAVRFGNVLGSSGSVIPRFRRQIAQGGPVTVTHPEMRRFFMTIPEAAQLVLEAAALGAGGGIFVLDMGEPVRIVDLARKLVLLSGLRPEVDIPIVFTGARPGEKLYEELTAYEENTAPTPHRQIRVFTGARPAAAALQAALEDLHAAVGERDAGGAVLCLKQLVPDYNPSNLVLGKALAVRAHSVVA